MRLRDLVTTIVSEHETVPNNTVIAERVMASLSPQEYEQALAEALPRYVSSVVKSSSQTSRFAVSLEETLTPVTSGKKPKTKHRQPSPFQNAVTTKRRNEQVAALLGTMMLGAGGVRKCFGAFTLPDLSEHVMYLTRARDGYNVSIHATDRVKAIMVERKLSRVEEIPDDVLEEIYSLT